MKGYRGRGAPRVTAALEAALVLQQAGSLHSVARDNRRSLPGRFSTLPARRNKKRPELPIDPVGRSASDAGTWTGKDGAQRKRSGSESEGSHLSTQPFHFGASACADRENNNRPKPKKPKKGREEKEERASPAIDVDDVISTRHPEARETIEGTTTRTETRVDELADNRSPSQEAKVIEHHIFVEGRDDEEKRETAGTSRTPSPPKERKRGEDEVDQAGADSMLHSSRYDLQQRNQQESTIHKMIHRLSNDRSPPPQLTRTMVPPPPAQTNVIYAQVQPDKKKAQRSHSDSDEGLGLERKDSSRENSPAEKEYRRAEYSYSSDLRRNNEINTFKSRYEEDRKNGGLFGKHLGSTKDFISRTNEVPKRYEFDDIDRRLYDKPEKYTSTVFVDTSGRGRADADEMFAAKNGASVKKSSEHEIIDKPIVPNGEKYIFEKEIHEDNGKVYGYEKKITNKIPTNGYLDAKPKDGYTVETRTDKYGDKYIVETRTHEGYADNLNPFLGDRNRSSPEERFQALSSPIIAKKLNERKFSKSDDFLDRENRPIGRDAYLPKKKPFESIRGMSKSTQRLDEVAGENARMTSSQLESNSPPRIRTDRGGYNSSRYDSDTTARDSIRCETRYDETSSRTLRKEHRKPDDDPKKPLRRSRNRLDYFDDSDGPRGKVSSVSRLETFNESPTRPPRTYHEGKSRHARQETRGHVERRHRETRLSDPDRKDRLADSGIENDYRRDSQEADRREQLESEDEGFVSRQFIKHERRHTDRNMNLTPTSERRKYANDSSNTKPPLVTAKPPTGAADKKYEKKVAKKSGTMSKVKQLFSKKEKKAKEEKGKKSARSGSSGALTDDEVTMRYREYRGDQLRSAKSARDLGSDINQVSFIFHYDNGQLRMLLLGSRILYEVHTIGSSISRVKRNRRYPVTELSLSDVAGIPYEE
ncbi:myb-like protein x-like isoform x1 protein [Lasius niger]|uniref:Myb-like protein x-like isoform x1 protein n=1 Tax=Lasius niger TaxID=67767 RepID=A0A0J7L129_LASNI|nr:myb-like protein x-like isoform x1 protein [Lasius niger]